MKRLRVQKLLQFNICSASFRENIDCCALRGKCEVNFESLIMRARKAST